MKKIWSKDPDKIITEIASLIEMRSSLTLYQKGKPSQPVTAEKIEETHQGKVLVLSKNTSFQAPLYPYLLSFFVKFLPSPYLLLQLFQIIISVLAGVLLFHTGKEIFNEKTALITLMIYSFNPVFIFVPS